jgi:hypothetical protein
MDEDKDLVQQEYLKVLGQARQLQVLLGLPSWKVYEDILNANAKLKAMELEKTPIYNMELAVEDAYKKGILTGLTLALEIPKATVESFEAELNKGKSDV